MQFNNKVYDVLKWVCIIFLPALEVFLSVLLPALNVDPEITMTVLKIIPAVATFIGACIGISQATYNSGAKNEKSTS
jgi:hypothetical protein